ncbi:exopolysaccharide biosynthesis polyprenyl glycosylphosphotransferase [Apibacter raozihei]|uniref:exopolysaccharide biosynthesis polyprenyl glycosylphosphotransferase n=1 Tax=Apibacter raozihei TaxID=2500547 RepID=UPI000FE2AAD9|nr:exopolysaccharide biosynthesis polyprenyl glycosylphosphotransferase [Apibacter raozihei]
MNKGTRYSKYISFIINIIDSIIIFILFYLCVKIDYKEHGRTEFNITHFILLHYKAIILFIFSWFLISIDYRAYKEFRPITFLDILKRNIFHIFLFSIVLFTVSGLKDVQLFSNRLSLYFLFIMFVLTSFLRLVFFEFLRQYRIWGGNFRRVVFVDENSNTSSFVRMLEKRKDYGFVNFGIFLKEIESQNKDKLFEFNINQLKYYLLKNNIQIVFFSLDGKLSCEVQEEIIYLAQKLHIEIRFVPSTIYDSFSSLKMEYYDTFPVLVFKEFPLDNFGNQFLKRIFDIIFSLLVIVFFLSWMFPIIALGILLDSGKPIFYLQKRIGLKGKPFYCYKFRTMKFSKDNDVKATVKGDTRITKFGLILRRTSLDELPQFFNVLKGNMSIVGPRPHMVVQDEYYSEIMLKYSLRHYVKPGITGLAQVKGFRGEINSKEDMQKRIIADIFYVKNWSFLLDMFIIIRTVFKAIGGDDKAI